MVGSEMSTVQKSGSTHTRERQQVYEGGNNRVDSPQDKICAKEERDRRRTCERNYYRHYSATCGACTVCLLTMVLMRRSRAVIERLTVNRPLATRGGVVSAAQQCRVPPGANRD